MADITIGTVSLVQGTSKQAVVAAAVVPGDFVSQQTNNQLLPANATTAEDAAVMGLVLSTAAIGEIATYALPGSLVKLGSAIFTQADVYGLSANGGKMAPLVDLASTQFRTTLGTAQDGDALLFDPQASGVAKA